ncbi:MAG TPA: hypothetical protein VHS53_04365 [Mucilaginibacter sp.]|jgi:hypothetical protein|nr:hypothetical protein [Mucilaginibacter sp.]
MVRMTSILISVLLMMKYFKFQVNDIYHCCCQNPDENDPELFSERESCVLSFFQHTYKRTLLVRARKCQNDAHEGDGIKNRCFDGVERVYFAGGKKEEEYDLSNR